MFNIRVKAKRFELWTSFFLQGLNAAYTFCRNKSAALLRFTKHQATCRAEEVLEHCKCPKQTHELQVKAFSGVSELCRLQK